MSKEGYLLRYHTVKDKEYGDVLYFKLNEGRLSYYNKKGGKWLGEFQITGKALKVQLLPNDPAKCPHRILIKTNDIICKEEAMYYGDTHALEVSAANEAEQLSWGNSIHLWRRYFWREVKHKFTQGLSSKALEPDAQKKILMHEASRIGLKGFMAPKMSKCRSLRLQIYKPKAVTFSLPPMPVGTSPITVQKGLPVQALTSNVNNLVCA